MARKTFYISLSILFLLFLIQHVLIKQPDILSKMATAEDFSDINIEMLDSRIPEPIGMYENEKRVVLLFWASTSDPCRLALEGIGRRADKWNSEYKVAIISVNVGQSREAIEAAREAWDITLPIGIDEDKKISRKFGVSKLPTVVLLDMDGSIQRKWDAYEPEIEGSIRRRLDDDENYKELHIETDRDGNVTKITIDGEEPDSATRDSIIKEIEDQND
jgi:thiol-disulfide isomerase/thioredoxin